MGGASTEIAGRPAARPDRRPARGRALGPGGRSPAPPAGTSCPARRPAASSAPSTRSCRRSPPSARRSCWSSTAAAPIAAGRTDVGAAPAAAAVRMPLELPDRVAGVAYPPGATVRRLSPGRLRGRAGHRRRRPRPGAWPPRRPGGPTSPSPPTWSRRCCGWRATTPSRRCCPPPRPDAGSARRSGAGARCPGRWPRPATSRCCRSRSSIRRCGTRSGWPPTTCAAAPCTCSTRSTPTAPSSATTLLPGLLDTLVRNRSRGRRDLALFTIGQVVLPHHIPKPMPDPAVRPAADRRRDRPDRRRAAGPAGARRRRCWPATGSARGWWGPGGPADWADAVQAGRLVGQAAGVELRVTTAELAPWHPGRCAALRVGDWLDRARGRAAPEGGRGAGAAAAHLRDGARPRRDPARRRPAGAPGLAVPADLGGRRAGRRRPTCRRPRSPTPCATAAASCWRSCGCSTSTPASRSAPGKRSLAFALRFRAAGPHADQRGGQRRPGRRGGRRGPAARRRAARPERRTRSTAPSSARPLAASSASHWSIFGCRVVDRSRVPPPCGALVRALTATFCADDRPGGLRMDNTESR